jgi:hypothetical protein
VKIDEEGALAFVRRVGVDAAAGAGLVILACVMAAFVLLALLSTGKALEPPMAISVGSVVAGSTAFVVGLQRESSIRSGLCGLGVLAFAAMAAGGAIASPSIHEDLGPPLAALVAGAVAGVGLRLGTGSADRRAPS